MLDRQVSCCFLYFLYLFIILLDSCSFFILAHFSFIHNILSSSRLILFFFSSSLVQSFLAYSFYILLSSSRSLLLLVFSWLFSLLSFRLCTSFSVLLLIAPYCSKFSSYCFFYILRTPFCSFLLIYAYFSYFLFLLAPYCFFLLRFTSSCFFQLLPALLASIQQ